MIKKKPTFELKTLKSFIVCSLHWQTHQFQVLTPCFRAFRPNTRFSSTELMLCHSSGLFRVPSKPSSSMSDLMKLILVVWSSCYKSCRRLTARPKNWGKKRLTAIKKLMTFFTVGVYHLYPKPFKQSWLAVTTTIFWLAIFASRRLANFWRKVLLANCLPQCQSLRERLWRLFSLQSNKPQALQWSSIVAFTNGPMEGPFNGLYNRSTSINQLERRQFWLHFSHC